MTLADAALAAAADDNLIAHATDATRLLPRAVVRLGPELALVDSGLPCDTFNLVCRARLTPDTAPAAIADVVAFYGRTGHPYSWWLTPGFTPSHLPALLERSGFHPAETENAMARHLADLPPPVVPQGLEIRRVRTREQLTRFARLSAANWDPPDRQVLRYYDLAAARLLSPEAAQWLYLGLFEGEPVATAELTVGGGVVGLYGISTRPAARGRGIGGAMTLQPLHDARAAGHHTAILQASADGTRVYRRLGFQSFGAIAEFKPAPARTA